MPEFVIGLVTFNSERDLANTLASTQAVARSLNVDIVAYDNASRDGTVEHLRNVQGVQVKAGSRNRGFAYGVNRLFDLADGRHVLLLNPDVMLERAEAVEALVDHLADGSVGVIAPRLVNLDGSTQASARRYPSLVSMAGRGTVAGRLGFGKRAAREYVTGPSDGECAQVDWAIGAALLIRNEAFEAVRGWDEGFFLYLEDVDFCLRVARAGWKIIYEPNVVLKHEHHRASDRRHGNILNSVARRHHIRSTLRFFAKHRSLFPSA